MVVKMDTYEILKKAARLKETVTIVYSGGSQPGSKRQIIPSKVAREEIYALDLATHNTKNFKISKITIVPGDFDAVAYDPNKISIKSDKVKITEDDIYFFLSLLKNEVSSLGWHIKVDDNSISLHEYYKNGKPKKGWDSIFIFDTDNNSNRPFYVQVPGLINARTYSDFEKAMSLFVDQAIKYSPK